ncbi:hypothetical protein FPZ12_039365 [Amycolatopsis acidicola]|uniref:Uncharacterized protein n=1 Tax=Amycolatopsis acidicola TaxID=2596893 RepID=A0A5N0UM90_9PSEU|nr:hypothetical protein [Amycolatopsis acidicola]KAA9151201.1 hypothetical protein FPZ12_039365 [Amycolatopsis acidicola]
MRVLFHPRPGGGSRVVLHREDRVVLEMLSYDRKYRIPHDLAHAVTERELGLSSGVFGCLAAGALFSSATVVSGTLRHDAKARSQAILRANRTGIALAESLAGVLHDAVEHHRIAPLTEAREAWGVLSEHPFPYGECEIRRAHSTLTRLAAAWTHLPPGEGLKFEWPRRLTASGAPVSVPRQRQAPRRVR